MRSIASGVVLLDSHGGYLDLTTSALDQLVIKDPIGLHYEVEHTPFARGKFAAVRRARCLQSNTWYAAKVMRKRRRAQDVRHEILHEAAVLLLARPSARIVSLHQLYETPSEIILVLELAEGGELQRVIDEEESLSEESVRRYMTNILTALRFLHLHNIAHLDLKPQNLLLTGKHPESEVKLCDFGISRIILSDIEVREVLGTPDYVAPEILQYEPISLATDMWSVGVLAYVLLTGHSPFGGNTKQETFLNISQGHLDFPQELFEGVSSAALDFITRVIIVDPGCRLTVQEAMDHPWLSGVTNPPRPITNIDTQATTTPPRSPKCTPKAQHNGVTTLHPSSDVKDSPGSPKTPKMRRTHPQTPPPQRRTRDSLTTARRSQTPDRHATAPQSPTPPQRRPRESVGSVSATKSTSTTDYPNTPPQRRARDGGANMNITKNQSQVPTSLDYPSTPPQRRPRDSPTSATKRQAQTHAPPTPPLPRSSPITKRQTHSPHTPPQRRGVKETIRNAINKQTDDTHTQAHTHTPTTSQTQAPAVPSPKRRQTHTEKAAAECPRKQLAGGKENKEVKEKLRPSPICMRRHGSKGDMKSPCDHHKCVSNQACVSIILEKGIIC